MFGFLTKKEFQDFKANDFAHLRRKVNEIDLWVKATLLAIVLTLITALGGVAVALWLD